jgi:hypothetical protein
MAMSKRRQYEVRCELFERKCARPDCEEHFTVAQKLPSRVARTYQERRARHVNRRLPDFVPHAGREAERKKVVPIEIRLEGRRGPLELVHCPTHRVRKPRRPAPSRGATPAEIEALFPSIMPAVQR